MSDGYIDASQAWVGAAIILALSTLTEKERDAVVSHHIRGETLQQIADRNGRSRQAVSLCEQRGLAKMQEALAPIRHELIDAA